MPHMLLKGFIGVECFASQDISFPNIFHWYCIQAGCKFWPPLQHCILPCKYLNHVSHWNPKPAFSQCVSRLGLMNVKMQVINLSTDVWIQERENSPVLSAKEPGTHLSSFIVKSYLATYDHLLCSVCTLVNSHHLACAIRQIEINVSIYNKTVTSSLAKCQLWSKNGLCLTATVPCDCKWRTNDAEPM